MPWWIDTDDRRALHEINLVGMDHHPLANMELRMLRLVTPRIEMLVRIRRQHLNHVDLAPRLAGTVTNHLVSQIVRRPLVSKYTQIRDQVDPASFRVLKLILRWTRNLVTHRQKLSVLTGVCSG